MAIKVIHDHLINIRLSSIWPYNHKDRDFIGLLHYVMLCYVLRVM